MYIIAIPTSSLCFVLISAVFVIYLPQTSATVGSYAFMDATKVTAKGQPGLKKRTCINYDDYANISNSYSSAAEYRLVVRKLVTLCEEQKPPVLKSRSVATTTLPLNLSNTCSLTKLGELAQSMGAGALLVVIDPVDHPPRTLWAFFQAPYINYSLVDIPVYFILRENYDDLAKSLGKDSEAIVRFYQPSTIPVDLGVVALLLLAMVPLLIGGYWSGIVRHQVYLEFLDSKTFRDRIRNNSTDDATQAGPNDAEGSNGGSPDATNNGGGEKKKSDSDSSNNVVSTIIAISVIVIMMICVLLLLYYVYWLAIWFIITVFVIVSVWGIYTSLVFLWDKCPKSLHIYMPFSPSDAWQKIFCGRKCKSCSESPIDVTHIILYAACAALGICWAIYRKEWFAFILQDIMAVFFCIHFLKTVRLPNLKWITLLLLAFLIYDVFFVFITPLFTKSGCSIMVDVVTGGACSTAKLRGKLPRNFTHSKRSTRWYWPPLPEKSDIEQIPILFRIPRSNGPVDQCSGPHDDQMPAMLGFGDVMAPGLLIAYCHAFDLAWDVPYRLYFIASLLAYLVGLALTGTVLEVSGTPQPALLYLVPTTVIAVHCLALIRKQWRHMWLGAVPIPADVDNPPRTVQPDEMADLMRREERHRGGQLLSGSNTSASSSSASESSETSETDQNVEPIEGGRSGIGGDSGFYDHSAISGVTDSATGRPVSATGHTATMP